MYLAYTIFSDSACTKVRAIAHLDGETGRRTLQAFRDVGQCEPKEGTIIAGCRIDRIRSEDQNDSLA